ncbi:MAG: flavin reductase family protein [Bacteroidales bacterium]|nr:flavin reductase family protein [Bacteroidales bacterium]
MEDKVTLNTEPYLAPIPAALVTCGTMNEANIITIAWTGIICSDPPMTYISVTPERYSYGLLKHTNEFAINLTNRSLVWETHWCGSKSGRDYDKFAKTRLTPISGTHISAPLIKESPLNLECKVTEIKSLGSHDMFLAEIVAVHASKEVVSPKTGKFDPKKADLISFIHGKYYEIGTKTAGTSW